MRTSRISQETSKAITATASPTTRRSIRTSLTRFAHNAKSTKSTVKEESDIESELEDDDDYASPISDIEDALLPLKRKRNANGSTSSTPRKPTTKAKPTSSPRNARKPARKTTDATTGTIKVEPPTDWETIYNLAKEMRLTGAAQPAAVDTMGCERLALPTASERDQRYHTLTALMLSSQTKDTTNAAAMHRLQTELPAHQAGAPKGLNIENILAVDPGTLNELIWSVGFHNNKTRYIKAAAEILRDQYDSDIPDTIEGLTSLPGVGPKMGYLCLSSAWGKDEGIGVDVHVHRITNLWGWHGKETKGPEETRIALQSWLPRDKWREINWLLVGLGQTVCAPERGRRRCGECEVGLAGLCKSAERAKVNVGKKIKEEMLKVDIEDGLITAKKEEIVIKEEAVEDVVVNGPAVGLETLGQENENSEVGIVKAEDEEKGRKRRKW